MIFLFTPNHVHVNVSTYYSIVNFGNWFWLNNIAPKIISNNIVLPRVGEKTNENMNLQRDFSNFSSRTRTTFLKRIVHYQNQDHCIKIANKFLN